MTDDEHLIIARPGRATGGDLITGLWAWTCIDPRTGQEGIISIRSPGSGIEMPMVGSTRVQLDRFEPYVKAIANEMGAPCRLRRFAPALGGGIVTTVHPS